MAAYPKVLGTSYEGLGDMTGGLSPAYMRGSFHRSRPRLKARAAVEAEFPLAA